MHSLTSHSLTRSSSRLITASRQRCRSVRTHSWFSRAFSAFSGPQAPSMATERWWTSETVAVVTGANKGIGFEIARLLSEQGLTTVVTSRDEAKGKEATQKLKSMPGCQGQVVYHQLDVSDQASVDRFADWVKQSYGGLTILVNNAGFAYKGDTWGAAEAQATLDTNYFGTAAACEALTPLMGPGSRVINVCSMAGLQRIVRGGDLQARFAGASSSDEVTQLAQEFVAAVEADDYGRKGWPRSMYGISKLCEATYTRLLAERMQALGVLVAACCPGYCATDMSSWRGTKTAATGADTPVWLALQPAKEFQSGKFWQERREIGY